MYIFVLIGATGDKGLLRSMKKKYWSKPGDLKNGKVEKKNGKVLALMVK
jgi:hypothetical protein